MARPTSCFDPRRLRISLDQAKEFASGNQTKSLPLKLGDRKQVTVYMSAICCRTRGVQQAASRAGNGGVAAVQVQTEQVQGKHFWQNCASVFDSPTVPWSQVRRNARFMLLPQEWMEAFDSAYLAAVEEEEGELSSGFGGAIRKRKWEIGEEELFAELYGLLIGASPTLGVCTTPDGQPRLISAFLPETCFQHVQRFAFMGDWPMRARWKFVNDFALAIWGMHAQGLVHCDLKPDNVLAQIFPCT